MCRFCIFRVAVLNVTSFASNFVTISNQKYKFTKLIYYTSRPFDLFS